MLQGFLTELSEEAQATVAGSFKCLRASDITKDAVGVADQAHDFCAPNVRGGELRLPEALQQGPVMLSFYRGGWYPVSPYFARSEPPKCAKATTAGTQEVGRSRSQSRERGAVGR